MRIVNNSSRVQNFQGVTLQPGETVGEAPKPKEPVKKRGRPKKEG